MRQDIIAHIKSLGFRVFVPANPMTGLDTYCYYTTADGKNIAYFQQDWDGGVSTIHKPCHAHGTGYKMDRLRNPDRPTTMELEGGFIFAPHWASNLKDLVKYKDIDEFMRDRNKYHMSIKEVVASA